MAYLLSTSCLHQHPDNLITAILLCDSECGLSVGCRHVHIGAIVYQCFDNWAASGPTGVEKGRFTPWTTAVDFRAMGDQELNESSKPTPHSCY